MKQASILRLGDGNYYPHWQNQLTDGLRAWYTFDDGGSAVSDRVTGFSVPFLSTRFVHTSAGTGLSTITSLASGEGIAANVPNDWKIKSCLTLVWHGIIVGNVAHNTTVFGVHQDAIAATENPTYGFRRTVGIPDFTVRWNDNVAQFDNTIVLNPTLNVEHTYGFCFEGQTKRVFQDGVLIGTDTSGGVELAYGAGLDPTLFIGRSEDPANPGHPNVIHLNAMIWNRCLCYPDLKEIHRLLTNPGVGGGIGARHISRYRALALAQFTFLQSGCDPPQSELRSLLAATKPLVPKVAGESELESLVDRRV